MIKQLKILYCHCCGHIFVLCAHCYRGHKYCSQDCRIAAQRESHRKAQQKYRSTEKGRIYHRDYEKLRRMGKSKGKIKGISKTIIVQCCESAINRAQDIVKAGIWLGKMDFCHFCGRYGIIVNKLRRGLDTSV